MMERKREKFMKVQDIITRIAWGTKIAVRKDGKVTRIVNSELSDLAALTKFMNEEVQCLYVEDNELFIDLDKEF